MEESDPSLTDRIRILKIRLGDSCALEDLYQCHSSIVYAFALKMLRDPNEAQEALQDVFLQIWEKAANYDENKATVLSWMMMLTRYHCLDRMRSHQRKSHLLSQWIDRNTPSPSEILAPQPSCSIIPDYREPLKQALNKLPEEQKQSIEMAFFQGLTQFQIAEQTRQPLGTVKARIRRGMLKLRQLLKDIYA